MNRFSLHNRRALVTGSSQGIGLALGRALVEEGAQVVFHGLPAERPAELPAGEGYLSGDLLRPEAPAELIAAACELQPGLDTLVCNAGSFFDKPFLEMTPEIWARTMQLNVTAPYFLTLEFAKRLTAAGRPGCIVITTSTNGFQAEADSTAYDTSKGALVMLIRSLAVSLAPHRIRVNGIAPGLIRTPLTAVWSEDRSGNIVQHYEKKILLGRLGKPDDCAGAVAFLCSPAAEYLTGEIITIDGGLTVGQIGQL